MAGGSYGREQCYGSLVERGIIRMPPPADGPPDSRPAPSGSPSADRRPAQERRPARERRPAQERRPGGRHCWVLTEDGTRRPGLLSQWRQESDQKWVALVVYAVEVDGQPALLQAWIPADRLRPADADR